MRRVPGTLHRIRIAIAAAGILVFGGGTTRAASPSCPVPAEVARVAAIVDDADIALEDGRTLTLAGLDPARPTPTRPDLGEAARRRLTAWLVGRDVKVAILSALPDRWERLAALVASPEVPGNDAPVPSPMPTLVNEALVVEGLARVRPDAVSRPCLAGFLTLEEQARHAGLGLWTDPYYAILDADDGLVVTGRTGAMALVEGRVTLHEFRGRLYLNFGDRKSGVAAVLDRNGVKSLARSGLDTRRLVATRLRIRGFLDDRFGARIDVTRAEQIEILEAAAPKGDDALSADVPASALSPGGLPH